MAWARVVLKESAPCPLTLTLYVGSLADYLSRGGMRSHVRRAVQLHDYRSD